VRILDCSILFTAGAFAVFEVDGKAVRLPPEWAGLARLVSILPVVVVALQMKWGDYGRRFKEVGDYGVVKRAIEGDSARYHQHSDDRQEKTMHAVQKILCIGLRSYRHDKWFSVS
jgi:hypothetical protein